MSTTANIYTFRFRSVVALSLTSLVSLYGFLWPFLIDAQSSWHQLNNQIFFFAAVPLALALLIAEISNQRLDAKSVALLGVLAALTAALRPMGAGAAGIEPMWFILILGARVFGPSFGFILGILSMFVSAILTGGFGPWLAYQMFAAGWIGLAAGALPNRFGKKLIRGRSEVLLLVLFGAVAAFTFGLLMDLQFWPWALGAHTQISYSPTASVGTNFHHFIIYHFASSMAWDVPRAILTSMLMILTAPAVLFALRRTQRKAAFVTPIEFQSAKEFAILRETEQKAL
ncbi:MAG: ECF transporter S component [Candidatus Nanopelagicaceae bacterium]|nr:ECF transporter S component [Candidatus Nanopelagicaceae bacterium]